MSTLNNAVFSSFDITKFYLDQLSIHGSNSKGVGWKNDQAQFVRFAQLAKLLDKKSGFSINDLGCGTGKLYHFFLQEGYLPSMYQGYDILEEMIEASKQSLPANEKIKLRKINSAADMDNSDYSVASGIFNVKYAAKEDEWLHYVLTTIDHMNAKSTFGFAFNLLTKYADKEFMQSYLYYADPLFFFDYCKRKFSKNVALLHDYDQYDFTIIVRKGI